MECLNLIGNYHIHEKHLELGAGEEAPETGDWLYLWPKELDRTKWTNMDNISPSQSTSRLLYTKMDKYTIGWHLGIRRSLFWRLNYTQRVLVSDKEYFKSNKIIPMMLLQLFVIPASSSSNFAFAGHTKPLTLQFRMSLESQNLIMLQSFSTQKILQYTWLSRVEGLVDRAQRKSIVSVKNLVFNHFSIKSSILFE